MTKSLKTYSQHGDLIALQRRAQQNSRSSTVDHIEWYIITLTIFQYSYFKPFKFGEKIRQGSKSRDFQTESAQTNDLVSVNRIRIRFTLTKSVA